MSQPIPTSALPFIVQSPQPTESPTAGSPATPSYPAPERYYELHLLTEVDYGLDDTLTEAAGMARNPGALGAYAGSF